MIKLNPTAQNEAEKDKQQRVRRGRYTAGEAVDALLEHVSDLKRKDLLQSLANLVLEGNIQIYRSSDGFIAPVRFKNGSTRYRAYDDEFDWKDLNNIWLSRYISTDWRFPEISQSERLGQNLHYKKQIIKKSVNQDKIILELIESLGYNPLELPLFQYKRWVKSDVKEKAVNEYPSYFTKNSFKKCWERLRSSKQIKEAS